MSKIEYNFHYRIDGALQISLYSEPSEDLNSLISIMVTAVKKAGGTVTRTVRCDERETL